MELLLVMAILVLVGALACGCAFYSWAPDARPSDLGKVQLAPAQDLPFSSASFSRSPIEAGGRLKESDGSCAVVCGARSRTT